MDLSPRPALLSLAALAVASACTATHTGPAEIAAVYAEEGRLVEASRELEIARRRRPGDAALLIQAAAMHEQLGALQRAVAALEEAIESAPRDPAVWAAWAAFEERRGHVDSAYVAWRRARALAPMDPTIARGFARAAERAGLDVEEELQGPAPASRAR